MSLTLGAALGLGAGMGAVNLGGSFLGALFNKNAAEAALEKQVAASKELLDYQMEKYQSPLAQMKQIGKAGLNPAAMFGNTAPVNVGGSLTLPNAPIYGVDVGMQSLSDVASLLVGAAQAKKAGVEVPNIEADTQQKMLDNQRKEFENTILQKYGLEKSAAELALAWQNVKLAESSTDLNVQKKASESWITAKEKALSECSENQREILKKELDNKDTQLQLSNELLRQQSKTEQSQQVANYASAANQRSQAEQNEIFNKIYNDKRYQHSIVTQAVEAGRQAVQQSKISKSQAEHMTYLVEQAAYANDMKEFTYWSGQVNQFVNTLGSAASQFYGAGALRELINLRKAQQASPVSVQGFK